MVSIKGVVSCARDVNVGAKTKSLMRIHKNAKYFVWCYPFLKPFGWAGSLSRDARLKDEPDVQFLMNGGFIYMDKDYNPIQLNAAVPCSGGGISFGKPKELGAKWLEQQMNAHRFQ